MTTSGAVRTCGTCHHWRARKRTAGRAPVGLCKRDPPSVTISRDETGPGGKRDHVARWPLLGAGEEGCGGWEEASE